MRQGRDGATGTAQPGVGGEHRSVAGISGTPGARRSADDQGEAQRIAGKVSHGATGINDASGVNPKRRRASREPRIRGRATGESTPGKPAEGSRHGE